MTRRPTPPRRFTPEERATATATVVALYREGHTIACCAAAIGRPWNTTQTLLRRADVRMRPGGHRSRCTGQH